jgi:cytochrome c-type biogenesis protein CcmH
MTSTILPSLKGLLLAVLVAMAVPSFAIDTQRAFDDPALQARYEQINRELRCLVCQNQTIADSNATLAQDLRREVREMIEAGKSDAEIRDFMIERYGDFVLYRPRMTPVNFLLWGAPVLLLLLGTFIGIRIIRKQAASVDDESPEAGKS